MALPGWIGPASQILGGFLGRKKSAAQKAAEEAAKRKAAYSEKLLKMADQYDPEKETRDAVDYGVAQQTRNTTNAIKQVNLDAAGFGGGPSSNRSYATQQAVDGGNNAIGLWAAQQKAANFAKKMSMMQGAFQSSNLGGVEESYNQIAAADNERQNARIGGIVGGASALLSQIPMPSRAVAPVVASTSLLPRDGLGQKGDGDPMVSAGVANVLYKPSKAKRVLAAY